MNVHELKIKALLEGLEAENIEEFMRKAKISDYRNYGKAYISAVREKIKEKELLFITEDGVKVFDMDTIVYIVRNNASARIKISAAYVSKYDLEHKVFFHESNADEYIWKNKRLFSYNDLRSWDINGGTQEEALKVAIERSKE